MLNIGLIILISIDFILLSIGKIIFYLRVFKVVSFKDLVSRFQKEPSNKKNQVIEDEMDEDEDGDIKISFSKQLFNVLKSVLLFIPYLLLAITVIAFGIAIILLSIGIPTSSIWGTILLAIYKGPLYAVLFLLLMRLIYFIFGLLMLKVSKVPVKRIQRVLIMDTIQFTMLALLLYLAAFGYPMDVYNFIVIPFGWDIVLNNLLSILLPVVFYALLITNVFALFIRFRNIVTKDRNKHRIIRIHQLIFIFISACYFGILYLTDIDFSFMSELERSMYLETLEVVKWINTSVFIPLFLYTLSNYRKTNTVVRTYRKRTSSRM